MIKFNKELINTHKKETLYVAVSMGEDSVALSHFLSSGYRKLCFLHIDHKTGYSETAVQAFKRYVHDINTDRKYAYDNKKPDIEHKILVNDRDGSNMSEQELRDVRYGLIGTAVPAGSEVIVCHHLQDCVESYIMNCLNGRADFVPIPVRTNRSNYTVVRPFLTTTKKSILTYLKNKHILGTNLIAQDPSNSDTAIRRNWVRHSLLPHIKEEYKGIDTVVRKKVSAKIDELIHTKF